MQQRLTINKITNLMKKIKTNNLFYQLRKIQNKHQKIKVKMKFKQIIVLKNKTHNNQVHKLTIINNCQLRLK